MVAGDFHFRGSQSLMDFVLDIDVVRAVGLAPHVPTSSVRK